MVSAGKMALQPHAGNTIPALKQLKPGFRNRAIFGKPKQIK
jgi:hypothetical protein